MIQLFLCGGDAPAQAPLLPPPGGQGQVLHNLHGGGGAQHRVLEHSTDVGGALILRQAGHVHSTDGDSPFIHRPGAGHSVEHGRLTRSIAADDGAEIAIIQSQADAPQGLFFVDGPGIKGFPDFFNLKHGLSLLCGLA